ncbi:MAG: pantoate--beta-alanine ligase [Prevotellaceae bacterium]|jgi:pantoate--beta-alanine ligase|nr:pantoate--beta-alanine ligase [Prevotellaceae bacterium]
MLIVHTATELRRLLHPAREQKKTIGLVPTMGALHCGHLSLVRACREHCSITVVSIFVNPTQFNNPNDLRNYPRDLKHDCDMLLATGADIVFAPDEKEIYPKPDTRRFYFGQLETGMEGAHRPGHFNGVAQVVSRLFDIVQPAYACFGEKDFQQLAIIRALTEQTDRAPKIIACPIVREADGLAMSSRNTLLSTSQRAHAPLIAATLMQAQAKAKELTVNTLRQWVIDTINADRELEVEYAEIVHERTLQPIEQWREAARPRLCVAVYARPVRLIDNICLRVES